MFIANCVTIDLTYSRQHNEERQNHKEKRDPAANLTMLCSCALGAGAMLIYLGLAAALQLRPLTVALAHDVATRERWLLSATRVLILFACK